MEVEDHCYVTTNTKCRIDDVMKDRRLTLKEFRLYAIFKSKSFVFTILTEEFGMSRFCARLVPILMSDDRKQSGCKQVNHFIQKFKAGEKVA